MEDKVNEIIRRNLKNHSSCYNLSHLGLTLLPEEFKNILWVKSLLLNHNQLIVPPSEISLFAETLTELILAENNLTVFPSELGKLKSLKILDVSHNCIAVLPNEIGCLSSLQQLWANHCSLFMLPENVGNLKCLSHLGIKNNELKTLPKEMVGLENLQWLNCESNNLESLRNIQICNKILFVDLSFNKLDQVPEFVKNKPLLKVLLLCGNEIAKLDDESLLQLSNVEKLDLRENLIQKLPSHWKGMNHIMVGEKITMKFEDS